MKKYFCKSIAWLHILIFGILLYGKKILALEFDEDNLIQEELNLPDPEGGPESVIIKYLQMLLAFLALNALIMIIIGGMNWMFSGGNEEKIAKAKKLLTASVIGMIVILMSWVLVYFIFDRVNFLTS